MPLMQGDKTCPICRSPTDPIKVVGNAKVVCRCCGAYELTPSADAELAGPAFGDLDRAKISYALRRRPPQSLVDTYFIKQVVESVDLPGPTEMLDNAVVFMAEHPPGTHMTLYARHLRGWVGAVSIDAAGWVMRELHSLNLITIRLPAREGDHGLEFNDATLSTAGWAHHRKLLTDAAGSRHAFMAMKFNDPELDKFFVNHLKPAVAQTGFILRKLDDSPSAGLIDNRLRVEIRTSRFLVCDLSHGNRGAYWEAGFAEGLGRPVIYLCRDDVFTATHPDRPHFDTNHHAIIKWSSSAPQAALEQLKNMIRATLPLEAKMED